MGTTKLSSTNDPLDPAIIESFANMFLYKPTSTTYYSTTTDEVDSFHLSRILGWYKDKFSLDDPANLGASFLIPIGAIRALQKLANFSNQRLLVLSGDKGVSDPESMRGLVDPHIAVHGSFSMMVNYHAIGAYFTSKGGFALHNRVDKASLKCSCFVLPGLIDVKDDVGFEPFARNGFEQNDAERQQFFPNLLQAFEDHIDLFGPNDFFVIQKCVHEETGSNTSLRSMVSLLKLSNWDSEIFFKFREMILAQAPSAGIKLRIDLCRGIPLLWRNYFGLGQDTDIAFEIGRLYYALCNYREALVYYQLSVDLIGPHHVTFHNMVRFPVLVDSFHGCDRTYYSTYTNCSICRSIFLLGSVLLLTWESYTGRRKLSTKPCTK